RTLAPAVAQVLVSGRPGDGPAPGVEFVLGPLKESLGRLRGEYTVLMDRGVTARPADLDLLCAPIASGDADVVVPLSAAVPEERPLNVLARSVTGVKVKRPVAPIRAVRTEVLRTLQLSSGPGLAAELVVKLAAQAFRFAEVPLEHTSDGRSSADWLELWR